MSAMVPPNEWSNSSFLGVPKSVAGGTLKLKDELKFTFDIVARRQE